MIAGIADSEVRDGLVVGVNVDDGNRIPHVVDAGLVSTQRLAQIAH